MVRTVVNTNYKITMNGKQYLVNWKGVNEDQNTLEPAKIFEKDIHKAVKDYKQVPVELRESPMNLDLE